MREARYRVIPQSIQKPVQKRVAHFLIVKLFQVRDGLILKKRRQLRWIAYQYPFSAARHWHEDLSGGRLRGLIDDTKVVIHLVHPPDTSHADAGARNHMRGSEHGGVEIR